MSRFFRGLILALLTAGTQSLHQKPSQEVYNVNDKNLPHFDILEVIVDDENSKIGKTVIVNINERILTVHSSENAIAFTLDSVRPTSNGDVSHIPAFTDEAYTLRTSKMPPFDALNITINKVNNVRSEKVIKIYANEKIIGMDTRNQAIDLYLKNKKDEHKDHFIIRYPLRDRDGDKGSISHSSSGPNSSVTSISSQNSGSIEKTEKGGNSGHIRTPNGLVVLCFVLWHLVP